MFVVVLIKSLKRYVVVPEEWVFDINEQSLKNNGVNRNRNVLMFWSENGIGNDNEPDHEYKPNFTLKKETVFPPPDGQGCYIVRMIHFYGG